MKKTIMKIIAVIMTAVMLAVTMPFSGLGEPVLAATNLDIDADEVFMNQPVNSVTCTLVASVMMLRRAAIILGQSDWRSITPDSAYSTAWIEGSGLRGSFSFHGMHVTSWGVSGFSREWLKSLLHYHAEGIMVYASDMPHAILITDYDFNTDTFYCADPGWGTPAKRIPLSQSSLWGSGEDGKISYIRKVWAIDSPNMGEYCVPLPVTPSVKAGTSVEPTVVSWNKVAVATHYMPYIVNDSTGKGYSVLTTDNKWSLSLPVGSYTLKYIIAINNSFNQGGCNREFTSYSGSVGFTVKEDPNNLATGKCGDNAKWVLGKDGVLTISGTGRCMTGATDLITLGTTIIIILKKSSSRAG